MYMYIHICMCIDPSDCGQIMHIHTYNTCEFAEARYVIWLCMFICLLCYLGTGDM